MDDRATTNSLGSMLARASRSTSAAISLSLLLHALVFSLFVINWPDQRENRVVQPRAIQASLIIKDAPSESPTVQKNQKKTTQKISKPRSKPKPAPTPTPTPVPAAVTTIKEPRADNQQSDERRDLIAAQQLENDSDDSSSFEQPQASSYVAAIAARLAQEWSRPPSARLGMSATLRINTVPTGRVVAISVINSSGNEAFDRSVQLAVERVGQLDMIVELYQLDPALYERQFRQLDILFSPEDLRL